MKFVYVLVCDTFFCSTSMHCRAQTISAWMHCIYMSRPVMKIYARLVMISCCSLTLFVIANVPHVLISNH